MIKRANMYTKRKPLLAKLIKLMIYVLSGVIYCWLLILVKYLKMAEADRPLIYSGATTDCRFEVWASVVHIREGGVRYTEVMWNFARRQLMDNAVAYFTLCDVLGALLRCAIVITRQWCSICMVQSITCGVKPMFVSVSFLIIKYSILYR